MLFSLARFGDEGSIGISVYGASIDVWLCFGKAEAVCSILAFDYIGGDSPNPEVHGIHVHTYNIKRPGIRWARFCVLPME